MSKQYLTAYTSEQAHSTDIYGLAVTKDVILSISGESTIKVWDTKSADHPQLSVYEGVHKLGAHHIAVNGLGDVAVTVGFDGNAKFWDLVEGTGLTEIENPKDDIFAAALSPNGKDFISTTHDGRVVTRDVRDLNVVTAVYPTKGSFGLCVDCSADGRFAASGHANGGIYVFSRESGRMIHSLSGLLKPIRAIKFSPGGRLLAAAGESNVIGIYDVVSGEQVANFTGHQSWIFSVSWSSTGEYLLSGAFDGKVKVWSIDTKECVATHNENEHSLYSVSWLPAVGINEGFVTAGASGNIVYYREAMGG